MEPDEVSGYEDTSSGLRRRTSTCVDSRCHHHDETELASTNNHNEKSTDRVNLLEGIGDESSIMEFLPNTDDESNSLSNDLSNMAHNMAEQTEEFMRNMWNCCHFHALPAWLQDNDYLHTGHRPPLNSFNKCFKSIFRIHTETVNIWTHLLGCIVFLYQAVCVLLDNVHLEEKLIFTVYFFGTVICLGLSSAFHTLHCHSEYVGRLFSKLDYCGIAVLIMVSFVPWLYYGFYCHMFSIIVYLSAVIILGISSIIVSLWEKFSDPNLRSLRAGVFITFGLSGIVPALHYVYMEGWFSTIALASIGWLLLMGVLYILGAIIYALRIPERFFPGKCDILFQSHQIFHVLVLLAAFVHYHGISKMASYRISMGACDIQQALV